MPVLLPAERRWPSSQDEAPNQWTTSRCIHSMDVRDSLYCMSDASSPLQSCRPSAPHRCPLPARNRGPEAQVTRRGCARRSRHGRKSAAGTGGEMMAKGKSRDQKRYRDFASHLEQQLRDPRFRKVWERTRAENSLAAQLVRLRAEQRLMQERASCPAIRVSAPSAPLRCPHPHPPFAAPRKDSKSLAFFALPLTPHAIIAIG